MKLVDYVASFSNFYSVSVDYRKNEISTEMKTITAQSLGGNISSISGAGENSYS